MDECREDMTRIHVDSLRDWHRMKASFGKAIFDQFDQRIRQSGLESERETLLPYAHQFIDATFEKAKTNLRINGKKFEDLKDEDDDREIEPFDEALDRQTWSLYNQRLQWDLELATKRRKRPQEVVDVLEKLFQVQGATLGELDPPIEEDEDRPDDTVPNEVALAETNDTFSKVAAQSGGLQQTVKTQHERLRRLQEAEEEVNAIKS